MLPSAAPSRSPHNTASPVLPRAPKYCAPPTSGQKRATRARLPAKPLTASTVLRAMMRCFSPFASMSAPITPPFASATSAVAPLPTASGALLRGREQVVDQIPAAARGRRMQPRHGMADMFVGGHQGHARADAIDQPFDRRRRGRDQTTHEVRAIGPRAGAHELYHEHRGLIV